MTNNQIVLKEDLTSLTKPTEVLALANSLSDIILRKRLAIDLQGKKYVMVEGWQLAGALCGLYPVVDKVENLSDGDITRYRAEVSIKDQEGNIVGSGMAICTNKEKGKERFGEYAICSMAQTRAVGKAMRLKIGWIMKLAGFQATPSEEMGEDGAIEEIAEANVIDNTDWVAELEKSKDLGELYKTWLKVPKEQQEELKDLKDEIKAKLTEK